MIEYIHPAFMVFCVFLIFQALRHGLVLRRSQPGELKPGDRHRHRKLHLRYAKLGVVCVVLGALGGLVTMGLHLGKPMISTVHGMCGVITAATFVAAGKLGREVEAGDNSQREIHAWTAFIAILAMAITVVAGLVLLP